VAFFLPRIVPTKILYGFIFSDKHETVFRLRKVIQAGEILGENPE
jgi:hypothetical protein